MSTIYRKGAEVLVESCRSIVCSHKVVAINLKFLEIIFQVVCGGEPTLSGISQSQEGKGNIVAQDAYYYLIMLNQSRQKNLRYCYGLPRKLRPNDADPVPAILLPHFSAITGVKANDFVRKELNVVDIRQ